MKKIVFMGAKNIGFRCLEYLHLNSKKLNISIVGILTNDRGLSIKEYALNHNLPFIQSLDEYLLIENFDILLSIQYHLILKKEHIKKAKEIAINLHMAPLPEYRGCNQFSYAIINNDNEFGTTIHILNEEIDNGDILFQKRFPIPHECWVEELSKITNKHSYELFCNTLEKLINQKYKPIPQKSINSKKEFHLRCDINNLKQIDLNWSEEKIQRYIRATYMPGFESPYTLINREKIYFTKIYQKKG